MSGGGTLLNMTLDFLPGDAGAVAAAGEFLVRLTRCGATAVQDHGSARIVLPDGPDETLPVSLDPPSGLRLPADAVVVSDLGALLRLLVDRGVVPASAAADEARLMNRLVDLGYL